MYGIFSYCFVVFSEQLPPRKFAVSSLVQESLTKDDRVAFVELAAHLGVVQTRLHGEIVLNMLNQGQPWKFFEEIRGQEYTRETQVLTKRLIGKYGIKLMDYFFQKKITYQVGTDRRVLALYNIRDPWSMNGDLEALMEFNEPIRHCCDAYTIGNNAQLNVLTEQKRQSSYVFYEAEFPSL